MSRRLQLVPRENYLEKDNQRKASTSKEQGAKSKDGITEGAARRLSRTQDNCKSSEGYDILLGKGTLKGSQGRGITASSIRRDVL